MYLGEIVKRFRDENKLSMDDFAERSNLSKSYIAMLEKNLNPSSGKPISPTVDAIKKIAKAMNLDFNDLLTLMEGQEINLSDETLTITPDNFDFIDIPTMKIPLLGTVACGTPTLAEENIIDYIDPIEFVKADYCLIAKGDSMINANIEDGDIVFVKQTNQVDNGQIAVVLIDEEATLKRFRKTKDAVMLIAENNEIDPIILTEEDDARVIGLATHITKALKW